MVEIVFIRKKNNKKQCLLSSLSGLSTFVFWHQQ